MSRTSTSKGVLEMMQDVSDLKSQLIESGGAMTRQEREDAVGALCRAVERLAREDGDAKREK